jgi:hypothetical protein
MGEPPRPHDPPAGWVERPVVRPEFFVLRPDGTITYGRRAPGESLDSAVRAAIPEVRILGTSTLGMARLWYHDFFTPDLPRNQLADLIVAELGYRHETGWYGPVAVSMDENPATGEVPPLPRELMAAIHDFLRQRGLRPPPARQA